MDTCRFRVVDGSGGWGGRSLIWFALISLGAIAACGGSNTDTPAASEKSGAGREDTTASAAALDGCDAIALAPPKPESGVQISVEMPLAPGEERQVCKLVLVPRAVNMNWSDGLYTTGSHHGLVARTTYHDALPTENIRGETVEDASQVATCESVGSDWDTQAVIAGGHALGQSANLNTMGTLPKNVALKIAANEVLELNFHMINTSDHPIHACYKQNLYGIPDKQVEIEAGTMFYYNSFVTIPANSTAHATMACPVSHDVTLAAQVSHMHRRGTGYTANLFDGDPRTGGKVRQMLYEGTDWQEPVVNIDTPALELSKGQWIQWTCDYENPENRNVAQGQQTTDEMCMFIATYWPRSHEMDWCAIDSGSDPYSASALMPEGKLSGSEFVDCWLNSPQVVGGGGPETSADRYATQSCFTGTCTKVLEQSSDFQSGAVDPASVTCD